MKNSNKRNYNDHKLTIYFNKDETMQRIQHVYDKYVEKYDGLATTKNRFIAALLVEGIAHFAKDNSIAWEVA